MHQTVGRWRSSAVGPLRSFAGIGLQCSLCARAVRRGAALRSCPPGRLSTQALLASPSGPPPLLHSTRHPTTPLQEPLLLLKAVEHNRGCLRRMPGDRRSEVKEEGRIGLTRSAWAVNRPGGHERSRSPGSLRSRRPMPVGVDLRMTAKGRKLTSTRQVSSQLASFDRSATRVIAVCSGASRPSRLARSAASSALTITDSKKASTGALRAARACNEAV